MNLKQIVISIENAPGRLFEVTNALGDAGINLRALNLVDTGAFRSTPSSGIRCCQSKADIDANGDSRFCE